MAYGQLDRARAAFRDASIVHDLASLELAGAIEARDGDRVRAARDEVAQADVELHQARRGFTQANNAARPPFELLLADPALQFDRAGEVLASITAYQAAVPATASAGVLVDFTGSRAAAGRDARGSVTPGQSLVAS